MASEIGYGKPPKNTRFGGTKANRRNNKGRPKSFDALRKLAQDIAHEELQAGDASMTTTEAILRKWASSKDPRLQMEFMAVAYGRTPNTTEITGTKENDGQIKHEVNANAGKSIVDVVDRLALQIAGRASAGTTNGTE